MTSTHLLQGIEKSTVLNVYEKNCVSGGKKMAAINTIAKEWADELRDGIAWLIVWKTGRSWNAQAVWLGVDNDTFEPEDLEAARNRPKCCYVKWLLLWSIRRGYDSNRTGSRNPLAL